MDATRLHRVELIFQEIAAQSPDKRKALLDERCGSDLELRDLVTQLLQNDSSGMGQFMCRPTIELFAAEPKMPMPSRVGSYRVLKPLGRGGMGVVYEAEQDSPRREVALKLIRGGLTSPSSLSRFRFEAEVLGQLQHPGIARIYEAGVTQPESSSGLEASQPFLAMELIRGESLGAFAKSRSLGIRERLKLVAEICDAVHYAHQKGVIHRDLKPGNIMVDATGPKVLDFGVARATNPELPSVTLQTGVGQLVGTIAYMSPEQLEESSHQADVTSDVYALGVMAYELLTNQLPFDVVEKSLPQAIRVICENDARPAGSVSAELRGDVNAMLSKAMARSPQQRYASAAEFASDIRRFLRYEPVTARSPSAIYQLQRFARRHRGLVAGFGAALIALVGGLSMAIYSLQVASHERDQKSKALTSEQAVRAEAEAVTRFMADMLASADPSRKGRDVRVMDLLEAAAQDASSEFGDQPAVAAALRHVIGRTYHSLGVYDQAKLHLEFALETRTDILGESALATLESMQELGNLYISWGKYADAQELLERSFDLYSATVGEEHIATVANMHELATLYRRQGELATAETLLQRTLTLRRNLLGEQHPDTLTTLNSLGLLHKKMGRYGQALEVYEETLASRKHTLGEEHPHTLTSMNNLAHLFRVLNRHEEAADLHGQTLNLRRRVLGNEHPHTLMSMDNLAMLLVDLDRFDEAEPVYEEALVLKRRVLGEEHPESLVTMNNLAALYYEQGRMADAESLHRQTLEARRRILGNRHVQTATSMTNLAKTLTAMQKYDAAETLHTEALQFRRETLEEDHPDVIIGLRFLGEVDALRGDHNAAIEWYRQSLVLFHQRFPEDNRTTSIHTAMAKSLRELGREDEADRLLNQPASPGGESANAGDTPQGD